MNMRTQVASASAPQTPAERVATIDWSRIADDLNERGASLVERLLSPEECRAVAALYPDNSRFRSEVVMARHGFGRGEYKYFSYPLPDLVGELRPALYAQLHDVANRWNEAMGIDIRYPQNHDAFLKRCH